MWELQNIIFDTKCLLYRVLKIGKFSKKRVNGTGGGQSKGFLLKQKDVLDATIAATH